MKIDNNHTTHEKVARNLGRCCHCSQSLPLQCPPLPTANLIAPPCLDAKKDRIRPHRGQC